MTKNWFILMKDELKSIEHIYSLFFIILSIFVTLYIFYASKALQLFILVMFGGAGSISYYHFIAFNIIGFIFPFICMILVYDAVYRDLEDERVRLIITKVTRLEYLISKLFARLIIVLTTLVATMVFLAIYSYIKIGNMYFLTTLQIFASLALMSIFLSCCYLFVSCFSKNPLFVSILIPFVSLILPNFEAVKKLSFYTYLTLGGIGFNSILFFACGAIIIFMSNVYFFNRKKL